MWEELRRVCAELPPPKFIAFTPALLSAPPSPNTYQEFPVCVTLATETPRLIQLLGQHDSVVK